MIVYYFRHPERLSEGQLADLADKLPPQQQQILGTMKNHRHRCEQVVAYLMLCHAIAQNDSEIKNEETIIREYPCLEFNKQDSEPPLWAFGEHGKPYITNHEGIHFNISHCSEAVAVGVSGSPIGIDVEGRRRFSDTLLHRAFNEAEQEAVKNAAEPELEFARIWTRKEAYFKWTGTGILVDHLQTIEDEALQSRCHIDTTLTADTFWLSIAHQ